jgi:diguanylate cyclase (GGDEF)-like protein
MRFSTLAKTNVFVGLVLILGFSLLSGMYYLSFYRDSMTRLEHEASQHIAVIYSRLSSFFIQPVSISRTMAMDSFLISYLSRDESYKDPDFSKVITNYLKGYNKIYDSDGSFLSLIKNNAFYTQDGFIVTIDNDKMRHAWYERSLSNKADYDVNIDIDKTISANNDISLFVNYKVRSLNNRLLGFIGICVHLDKIMDDILDFEKNSGVTVNIVDEEGLIQLSSHATGLSEINWLELSGNEKFGDMFRYLKNDVSVSNKDSFTYINNDTHNYVAVKYIPQLSWFLVVESYMGDFYTQLKSDIIKSSFIILSLMATIIIFISNIISKFEHKIKNILEDRLRYFHDATRYMYTSIYEIDISNDRFAPESRFHQFQFLKMEEEFPYSKSLHLLAERVIKKEFQEEFLATFSRENILREYSRGTEHLNMDCPVLQNGQFQWMRYDVHIFSVDRDKSIHTYMYAKDINSQHEKEEEACTDALTLCLTRGAAEQSITCCLAAKQERQYAFFIIDIDNFKRSNDTFGHAFGDHCIQQFARRIRNVFRNDDIIGRFGGDEFVVFLPCRDADWVREKAAALVRALDMDCEKGEASLHVSASIGVALSPAHGQDLATLYRNADAALYAVKKAGKNNFRLYDPEIMCGMGSGATFDRANRPGDA